MQKYLRAQDILIVSMKITLIQIFIMALGATLVSAADLKGQILDREISLEVRNERLEIVLRDIQKQIPVIFTYRPDLLPVSKRVSIDRQNIPLREALDLLLGPGIEFIASGDEVLLRPARTIAPDVPSTAPVRKAVVTVQGTVKDDAGQSLPGVNVLEKGTTNGTVTDPGGRFSLGVEGPNSVLVFSFIGYQTQEVPVGTQSEFDITLASDVKALDEVVIVGYGTEQKKDLTGAVSSVKAEDIERRQSLQVSDALQGMMPGVTVTRNNSAPGATSSIRVRGITTFNVNDPLVIVDGVPGLSINDINPSDIESISVLKDAASAAIYGSRASTGVILITTKRAEEGISSVQYNYEFGSTEPTFLPEYVSAKRYQEMYNERVMNDGQAAVFDPDQVANWESLHASDPDLYPDTDWQKAMLNQSSNRQRHDLSFSVGTKAVKSQASLGYAYEDGLYVHNNWERYTARVNNDFRISEVLSGVFDIAFKNTNTTDPASGSPVALARRYPGVYDNIIDRGEFAGNWALGKNGINPMAALYENGVDKNKYHQLTGRIGLVFEPLEGLSFRATVSPVYDFNKGQRFQKRSSLYDPVTGVSPFVTANNIELTESRMEVLNLTKQLLADYSKLVGDHNFSILAGYEDLTINGQFIRNTIRDFVIDRFPTLSLGDQSTLTIGDPQSGAYTWPYALQSYFGRVKYSFRDRYLIQINYRADGTSRFSEDNRWGYFPSVSAGWNIAEEAFMPRTNVLTQLKLRASAGSLGNQSISGSDYQSFKWFPYQSLIEFRNAYFYQGNQVVPVTSGSQTNFAVENIVWETTKTFGIGLDMAFLNDRLIFTGDYFTKRTNDILMDFQIPAYLGFELPKNNVGEIKVNGWEFQLGWRDNLGQLTYSASVNLSDSRSEVVDINDRKDFISGNTISIEGREFFEWYGYETDGLFQTQEDVDNSPKRGNIGAPGDIKFVDQLTVDTNGDGVADAGDGVINEADRVPLGGSLPRYVFGGNVSAAFKGFDFSLVFQGVGKQNDFLTDLQVRPFSEDFGNVQAHVDGRYWSPSNTAEANRAAEYPRLSRSSENNNYIFSDYWRVNGSYFRVKNIILGYTVPAAFTSKVKLKGARVYVSLRDFFSIHGYPTGWDPEVDATSYPVTKSILAGIHVKL